MIHTPPTTVTGHASGDGVPVVFLSGMLADRRMWQPTIEYLHAESTVRGANITPIFCELFDQDSVADMAGAVLARTPGRFALVGMSMGGYVAFEILRRAPERVTHLMLVNTRASADLPQIQRRRLLLARMAGRNRPFQGVNDALLDDMLHPANRRDRQLIDLLARMAEDCGADVFRSQSHAVATRPDSTDLLPTISVPCTVMVGEADRVISPQSHREMASRIPGARYVDVAGAGHYVPLEQPGVFADGVLALLTNSR